MKVNRAGLIPGLILIALGILFLLMQFFRFGPGHFLILLGLVFLVPYAATRIYGLLIVGCILAGLGIGLIFETSDQIYITVPIGLGLGFLAIFVVQYIAAGRSHWWPLVPGVILIITGLADSLQRGQVLDKGLPLLLIFIGLAILAGQFWQERRHGARL